jgi:hypothetical protein
MFVVSYVVGIPADARLDISLTYATYHYAVELGKLTFIFIFLATLPLSYRSAEERSPCSILLVHHCGTLLHDF